MKILHEKDIIRGGFAGIRENPMVKESRVFGKKASNDLSCKSIT